MRNDVTSVCHSLTSFHKKIIVYYCFYSLVYVRKPRSSQHFSDHSQNVICILAFQSRVFFNVLKFTTILSSLQNVIVMTSIGVRQGRGRKRTCLTPSSSSYWKPRIFSGFSDFGIFSPSFPGKIHLHTHGKNACDILISFSEYKTFV